MTKKFNTDHLDAKKQRIDSPLTDAQKAIIFAAAVRDKSLFRAAQTRFDMQAHFRGQNLAFGLLWRSANNLYERSGEELPDIDLLFIEAQSLLQDSMYENLGDLDLDVISRTIELARSLEGPKLKAKLPEARTFLQRYLTEAAIRKVQDRLSVPGVDLGPVVEMLNTEHDKIRSVATSGLGLPLPDALEQLKPLKKVPTGCSHLDHYMGGQADKEVYGFLAPYAGGKSTQAVQLCIERCRFEQRRLNIANAMGVTYHPQVTYLVTYEEELESIRHRLLAYAALVDKDSIEDGLWDEMSSSKKRDYKPYERKLLVRSLMPPNRSMARPNAWKRPNI